MREAIERYLDSVMRHANLSPDDEGRVRAELNEHLREMTADMSASQATAEVFIMFSHEFGDPKSLGQSIGASKGKARTFFKKHGRRGAIIAAAAIVLLLAVRSTVAEAFYVSSGCVAPALPEGSRCLVYKLASKFRQGDLIVYRPADAPDHRYLAVVESVSPSGDLVVRRNHSAVYPIDRSTVVGRVVLNTR